MTPDNDIVLGRGRFSSRQRTREPVEEKGLDEGESLTGERLSLPMGLQAESWDRIETVAGHQRPPPRHSPELVPHAHQGSEPRGHATPDLESTLSPTSPPDLPSLDSCKSQTPSRSTSPRNIRLRGIFSSIVQGGHSLTGRLSPESSCVASRTSTTPALLRPPPRLSRPANEGEEDLPAVQGYAETEPKPPPPTTPADPSSMSTSTSPSPRRQNWGVLRSLAQGGGLVAELGGTAPRVAPHQPPVDSSLSAEAPAPSKWGKLREGGGLAAKLREVQITAEAPEPSKWGRGKLRVGGLGVLAVVSTSPAALRRRRGSAKAAFRPPRTPHATVPRFSLPPHPPLAVAV